MKQIGRTKYYITNDGNVINIKNGKKLRPQNNGNGYLKITLTIEGIQIQRYIHRLVAELYVPNPNNKKQINHINGNKQDNRFSNLEWCTNSENQIHAHLLGLKKHGNELWNGKFSGNDLDKIRKMDLLGIKRYLIAREMGCSKSTISDILNGKRYKYHSLTGEELTIKDT